MRRPTRTELQGVRVRWVLTVEALGRTWRWSSSPCVLTDSATGAAYPCAGGLPRLEVLVAANPGTAVADPQPLTLEVPWLDALAILARGHVVRGTAELAWWPEGVDYAARFVVLVGQVTQASYEATSDPVSITIAPDAAVETREWPPPEYVADAKSWPVDYGSTGVVPDDIGRVYPAVFGSPGQLSVRDTASALYGFLFEYPGSPALRVESALTVEYTGDRTWRAVTLLIAIGRVRATTVDIVYPGGSADAWYAETFAVNVGQDALGRVVSTCTVSSSAAGDALETADQLYVAWADGYTTPRRSTYGDDGETISGAGGVIDYLMRRSSVPYDSVAWMGVRAYLDAWSVDTYIDEPVGPWTWLADVLLPGLPVSAVPGPDGVSPVVWRPDCRRDEAVDRLRVGHDAARASEMILRSVDESTARAEFAIDADTGDPRDAVTIAPEPDVAAGVGGTAWARTARDILGADGASTTAASWTSERGTAFAVAAWRTALAAGWYEVDIDVDQDRGYLQLGDVVLITDAAIGLSARPAQVGGITYRDDGTLTLRLIVWRNPALASSSVPLSDDPDDPPQ